jgi:15-cis-phytoene synthase
MSRDTSFYYSFLVLPPRKRRAIIAVWDFCRAVDDAVDEIAPASAEATADKPAQQLAMWRAELSACFAGAGDARTPCTPQGRALQPFIAEFHLPREPFEELITGVGMDLDQDRYPTFDALAQYCRRVASMVGLICLEIFGYRDERAKSYAINLGMALQLTNIIRDVAADLRSGRVYLPADDMARFGVTVAMLEQGRVTPEVRELLRYECDRAREYYRRASAELPRADARSLVAAEIMGGIYFAILKRIERAGYDVFSRRIRVPRPYRAVIALRIWAGVLFKAQGTRHKAQGPTCSLY